MPVLRREILVAVGAPIAITVAVLMIGAAMVRTAPAVVPASWRPGLDCYDAPVVAVGGSGVSGAVSLCIADTGARPAVAARGLVPGRRYSAWFLYFDQPAGCQTASCLDDNLFSTEAAAVFGHVGAGVADSEGTMALIGRGRGLSPRTDAQLTLLIVEHEAICAPAGPAHPLAAALPFVPNPGAATTVPTLDAALGPVVARAVLRLR